MSRFPSLFLAAILFLTTGAAANATAQERDELPISLNDAVALTLKNNFDLALTRLDVQLAGEERVIAESEFDPVLGSSVTVDKSKSAGTSSLSSDMVNESDSIRGEASVSKKTESGGELTAAVDLERGESNSSFQTVNPTYSSGLEIGVTQPLMKDSGADVNRWKIAISENNESIAREKLREKLSGIITETQETYWELVFLTQNLEVAKEFLERAKDLERRVRIQVDVGSLAPIEIVQAQASVASREELVISADNDVDMMADKLLKLMNPPGDSAMWRNRLKPTGAPGVILQTFGLDESVAIALANRPEIKSAKMALENSNVELVYYENQSQLALDVVGTLRLNGLRGSVNSAEASGFEGSLGDSFSDAMSGEYYNYAVGLQLTVPLGNRSAGASRAKALINVEKSILMIKSLERDVILETRDAIRQIENGKKQMEAASAARLLAEKKLEAEIRKFEVGSSTSFNVLEFQKDLASERSKELRSTVDYRKALARLSRAAGKTLEANGISLESE